MQRTTKKEFQARIDAILKFHNAEYTVRIIGKIPNCSHGRARLRCSIHGDFDKPLSGISRVPKLGKLVCPKCSMAHKDTVRVRRKYVEFLKVLKSKHGGTISLVGKYVDQKTKADFKCSVCGNISSCFPPSKIHHGCRVCANAKRQSTVGEDCTFDGYKFKLEGFEKTALSYILASTELKASEILGAASGKVTSVSYEFKDDGKGKYSHYYHPDFFVPKLNKFIEVKSTVTLGIHIPRIYRKNRAKAKACVALGYGHILVLVLPSQGVVMLDEWYKKSRKSLLALLRAEYMFRL